MDLGGSYIKGRATLAKSDSNQVQGSKKPRDGGAFAQELSFGYKYFFGRVGLRHAAFINYQVGAVPLNFSNDLIIALNYGFNTDLLINWTNDKLDREYGAKNIEFIKGYYSSITGRELPADPQLEETRKNVALKSSGLVIGIDVGASTWFLDSKLIPSPFDQVKNRTIFQLSGKFGVRWNHDVYNDQGYLVASSSIELGVKVPAFNVNYYRDSDGNQLEYKRMVSGYLNVTYNFKNKD